MNDPFQGSDKKVLTLSKNRSFHVLNINAKKITPLFKHIEENESKSLAVVNGQIQDKTFPIVCDSGSNKSCMPIECYNELTGLEIDRTNTHNLSGIATDKKSIGMVYDVPITLAPGCTIIENFSINEGHKHRELILSRTCLKRYNYDLLESRKHLAITCDDKDFFIPIVDIVREKK